MTTTASGTFVGHLRTAVTIDPAELPGRAAALLDDGFRVALVAGHDDGHQLRAVYLFTPPTGPARRAARAS